MPKDEITTTILAIRPGRREMGIAVLRGGELRFWGVAGFRQRDMDDLLNALERRLSRLITLYRPAVLAVEKPTLKRLKASPWLETIMVRICTVAVGSGLHFSLYDSAGVRERLCGSARATRREMTERIIGLYPHLARYRVCSSEWQALYWTPMFAAVAVGKVYVQE